MGRIIAYTIFSAMVVGALAYMVYDNIRFAAASSWPSVEGRITHSAFGRSGGGRSAGSYVPSVTYTYAAGGRNFSGYSIWLTATFTFSTAEEADAFLSPYRVGNPVRVFYDPANPADTTSIVERGGDPMIIFVMAGLWGLIATHHYPRRGNAGDGPTTQRPGQPLAAGSAPLFPPSRAHWGKTFRHMALATLIVILGYVVFVLVAGPSYPVPE